MTTQSKRFRQRGVAAVEFAIILPVLLFLMVATEEVGRAFYQYNTLTKSVRDGARYLSANVLQGTTGTMDVSGEIGITKARVLLNAQPVLTGFTAANITVTQVGTDHVQVSATYAFQPLWGALPVFQGIGGQNMTFNMQASITMRAVG